MGSRLLLVLVAATAVLTWLLIGQPLTPWRYEPVFGSRLLVVCFAVVLTALTLTSPTFRQISPQQRTVLSGLRLGTVVLVILFMLRPTCVSTQEKIQSAVLVLLLDQSRSMTLPHQTDQASRWQAQLQTLRENAAILGELAKEIDVKVYGYDYQLHPLEFKQGAIELPEAADGDYTDIGSPLYEAVVIERSHHLAGVILLGDGVQTAIADPSTVQAWQAAEELARLDEPLYTIAFGPQGSTTESRDVAVINLPDQYTVFVKNELTVQGTVQVRGFRGLEIPVELVVEDSTGSTRVVGVKTITAQRDDQQIDVQMSYAPQQTGQYRLTLRTTAQEGETVVKNNQLPAFLTVLSGGLRVLYLEGDLRMEQKFLRRSIDASQDIQLDFQWIDHRRRDTWPRDLTSLLGDPQYDVFIIGDLDSRALYRRQQQEENLAALIGAIEKGKGLMLLGGYHSFGPGRYATTPLADVLPIEIDRFEAQDFASPIRTDLHLEGPQRMLPSSRHFLTRLAPDDENLATWQSLPPLDGANRFRAVKDRASVFLETPDGTPLLVAGQYGGRVLAFAGDSTWRWWMQGHQDAHRRFWRQVILWLSRRDELIKDDVWIQLSQRRYDPGGRVEFIVGAKTGAGDVIKSANFDVVAVLPDGQRQEIAVSAVRESHVGRFLDTAEPGIYSIEVTARDKDQSLGTASAEFMVYDRDIELSTAAANHDHLDRLARQTKGRPVAPEELGDLLAEIKQRPSELKIEIPKKWQLGDTWQDAWLFFLGLVLLLSGEWTLRKKWGLV